MKVSVVVPSFNQARYLRECLDSILGQAYGAIEVIVMDGGSTDGSLEILREYSSRLTFWTSGPDGGQTRALIEGFTRSTGDVLCWINSDDAMMPDAVAEAVKALEAEPSAVAVFGDALLVDASGRPIKPKREIPFVRFLWLFTYNYIPGMSTYWRRTAYEQIGGLDPSFDLAMDADLWIRLSYSGPILHERRIWSRMRIYPEQKNQRLRDRSNAEDERIRAKYLAPWKRRLTPILRPLARMIRVAWKLGTGCYSGRVS